MKSIRHVSPAGQTVGVKLFSEIAGDQSVLCLQGNRIVPAACDAGSASVPTIQNWLNLGLTAFQKVHIKGKYVQAWGDESRQPI
jgi:hypothetical protein